MNGVPGEPLDDFADPSGWSAVASGRAQLVFAPDAGPRGRSLRLDFDFHGGGGFVVARKTFGRALPESWTLHLVIRGQAPANRFELKLADASGKNVWWFHRDGFVFSPDWQPLAIRSRDVEFAWGPAGGGAPRELGVLELAIVAPPGGSGRVWLAELRLEDRTPRSKPRVRASSALPGHAPERALDGSPATSWRSEPSAPQCLLLDFGAERELGGLVIDWVPDAGARSFDVELSDDGAAWRVAASARQAEGPRSFVYLPDAAARWLRLSLRESAGGAGFGIAGLELRPHDFSRSLHEFLHQVAATEPRGFHPRWLLREQSYWTPIGVDGGESPALLNEEGLLEAERGGFSLEPFLYTDGALVTWADAAPEPALAEGFLPLPASVWRARGLVATTSAFASGGPERAVLYASYRLENPGAAPRRVRLFVAIRPYQVTPPWQAFRGMGGVHAIRELAFRDGAVWVDGRLAAVPLTTPDGFGAAAFEQGPLARFLAAGALPARSEVSDDFGLASGALAFDLELAPGAAREIHLALPFGGRGAARANAAELRALSAPDARAAATQEWRRALSRVTFAVPEAARPAVDALRTATAHILLNRDGPALQPGPRRYTRSWIRDAATMSAALLRLGFGDAVRDFLRWYAPHQAADGNVPCCVDREGPDWLPEHDSHGQFVFTVAEHFRLTRDRALLTELWPAVLRAVDYLDGLRRQRLGPAFLAPDRRACFGILPESASHEGYLAHPVHAYWDDFWALRGLADAAWLAELQGDVSEAERSAAIRDALRDCLQASLRITIEERGLAFVPGSVEWADFDAAATASAIATTDAAAWLPADALRFTFDEYLAGFRRRRRGESAAANYSAYEIRIIGALLRLGRRDDAHELLEFFLADRRPRAWNQWPEISWRDPKSPGHLGDVPHAWIGAEWVLAVLALFAYEEPQRDALVLAAGVPAAWLDGGAPLGVRGLPTPWGPLSYTLARRADGALVLSLAGGLAPPPGGIVLRPPLAGPLARVHVDGRRVDTHDAESATLVRAPASVVLES